MKIRILTSIGMAVVGIPILIFSKYIVFAITVALLSFIAVFEMLRAVGLEKRYSLTVPAYIMAFAMPFLSYFLAAKYRFEFLVACVGVLFFYMIYV